MASIATHPGGSPLDLLYRIRRGFASGWAMFAFAAVIAVGLQKATPKFDPPPQTPIVVSLVDPVDTPPVELPPVPQIEQQKAEIQPLDVPVVQPKKITAPPKPTINPNAAVEEATPRTAPAPTPPRPPAPPQTASADSAYIGQVRAYLESIKRYPTSKEARLQHPRGEAEVWFVLDRGGHIQEAGIANSSGSMILDSAALQTVRGGSYPTIPSEAFAGQPTHRFTIKLNYTLEG